jgi:site-specific DNA recombinase
MTAARRSIRCAIYTRVSTEAGLDQEFNSLDAQYDAAQPISAVRLMPVGHWFAPDMTMAVSRADPPTARPSSSSSLTFGPTASMSLSSTKVDRLTRSLADFAKLVELFDASIGKL